MRQEMLQDLKTYLGIDAKDITKDGVLRIVLCDTQELIKNYCNVSEVPEGLYGTLIRMSAELYRNEQPGNCENPQITKSISEGDTSVSFGTAEASSFADSVLKDYKKQLNRYRKAVF